MERTADSPRAVLFDLDGTLIDTYRLYLESYRRALAPRLGYAPTDEEIVARRPSAERGFLAEWIGAGRVAECHAAMLEHYAALHGALGAGMYAWEITEAGLELGRFDVVVTEDDVRAPKPDPEGVLAAVRALGVAPGAAVYVGDSAGDLRAGRAAGTRVAAALWPKDAPGERERFLDEVRALEPDWTLERPADLTRLFAPWC